MRTSKFLAAVLLVTVGFSTLTSCQTDDPQSIYLPMTDVYPVTFETGKLSGGIKLIPYSHIYFCSNNFPFFSLSGGAVTIVPKSEKTFQIPFDSDSGSFSAKITTVVWENGSEVRRGTVACVDSLRWIEFNCPPQCNRGEGSYFSLTYRVPKEYGDYDFFLRFEYPAMGLYFESPTYRYTISEDESNKDWFRTSIVEL